MHFLHHPKCHEVHPLVYLITLRGPIMSFGCEWKVRKIDEMTDQFIYELFTVYILQAKGQLPVAQKVPLRDLEMSLQELSLAVANDGITN